MAIKASLGLRNKMLDTNSFDALMNLGFIRIFTGAGPASADDAATGTLLVIISLNSTGTGISFATTASAGTIQKAAAEVWSGVNAATGTAGYYRFVAPGDTGAASSTEARIQGTVGTAGADLNLSSVALISGATQTIDFFSVAFPTA